MTTHTYTGILDDVLTTAVEGGINYWANDRSSDNHLQVTRVARDKHHNVLAIYFDVAAVEDVSGEKVLATDEAVQEQREGEAPPRRLLVVTRVSIRRALRQITGKDGAKLVREDIRATALTLLQDPDSADYDAWDADAFVQIAVFGKLVYG